MQTKFFPPRFQNVDVNGDPIIGSLEFYLTGTTTKVTIYSDVDRTNPLTNPVNADSSGRFGAIWLDPADLAVGVKVVYYDATEGLSGGGVVVFTDDPYGSEGALSWDDLKDIVNRDNVGQTLWPQTAAEIAADITPTSYYYQAGNVLRYGADPSGVSDSHQAIQDAINIASFALESSDDSPSAVYIPTGEYLITQDLYNYYDANNNAGHNEVNNPLAVGRVTIYGDKAPGYGDLANDRYDGSTLKFSSGKSWQVSYPKSPPDVNSEPAKDQQIFNLGVTGNIDGELISARGWARSEMASITAKNDSLGTDAVVLAISDTYVNRFENIFLIGANFFERPANASSDPGERTNFSGTGMAIYRSEGSGGNSRFINVNANGFKTGFMLGDDFDGVSQQYFTTLHFLHCQAHYCNVGYDIRSRITNAKFEQCFAEYNFSDGTNPGIGYWFHHSAGYIKPGAATNYVGTIRVEQCSIGTIDTLEHYHVLLGSDAVDANESAHGNVILDSMSHNQLNTNGFAVRRYNSALNGSLRIRSPQVSSNGGGYLYLENEPQSAIVEVKGVEGLKFFDRPITDGTNTDMTKWLGGESDFAAWISATSGGSPDFDFSESVDLNRQIVHTPTGAGTVEIKLPSRSVAGDYEIQIVKDNSTNNALIKLDATAPVQKQNHDYPHGIIVKHSGNFYVCTIAGTTSGTSTLSPGLDPIVDGTSTWEHLGNDDHQINGVTEWTSANSALLQHIRLTCRTADGRGTMSVWSVFQTDAV